MKSFSHLNAEFGPACRPWHAERRLNKKPWSLEENIIIVDTSALPSAFSSVRQQMVDTLTWSNHVMLLAGTLKP